jgi:hypothetical protein
MSPWIHFRLAQEFVQSVTSVPLDAFFFRAPTGGKGLYLFSVDFRSSPVRNDSERRHGWLKRAWHRWGKFGWRFALTDAIKGRAEKTFSLIVK